MALRSTRPSILKCHSPHPLLSSHESWPCVIIRYASDYLIWRRLGRAAIIASLAVLIGLTALWVHVHKGGLDPAYCAKSCVLPLCAIMTCSCFGTPVRALAVTGGGGYYEPPIEHRQNVGSGVASSRGSSRARQPLMSRWKTVWINLIWPGHATGTRVFNGVLLGKIMLVLMLIATCIWALAWFVWAFCRPQVRNIETLNNLIASLSLRAEV